MHLFDAIRAGLEYASGAFADSPTSIEVEWRKADNEVLTAAWAALETLEANSPLRQYLDQALDGFERDPADSDYQHGYYEALRELRSVADFEGWL